MATTDIDPFTIHLEAAKKHARQFFFTNHRMYEVKHTDTGKVINIFGGFWQWHIDHQHKRLYEISKNEPDEAAKCSLSETFPLFVRNRTGIRDKLYRWSQEAMEMYLERLVGDDGKPLYVRQRNMLKVEFSLPPKAMMSRQKLVAKSAMIVLNTCWGKNTPLVKAFGVIGKVLWDNLDREICRYSLLMAGNRLSSVEYNLVWNNLAEVQKVAATQPGILPIWKHVARVDADSKGQYNCPNIVQDTRRALNSVSDVQNQLTKRGWKWLTSAKPLWVQYLISSYPVFVKTDNWGEAVVNDARQIFNLPAALDFIATVNEDCRFTAFHETMAGLVRTTRSTQLISMVRAAFRASLKKPAKTFYQQEVSLVLDWVTRGNPVFDSNQLKSDWNWFMRKQEEWHRIIARQKFAGRENREWDSLVSQFEIDKCVVVPLTTTFDLMSEGEAMHHCVGSYSSSCEKGHTRIFSIRQEGKSIATFEIRRDADGPNGFYTLPEGVNQFEETAIESALFNNFPVSWSVNQTRGPCNASVSHLESIAEQTAKEYGAACMKLPPKERFHQVIRATSRVIASPEVVEIKQDVPAQNVEEVALDPVFEEAVLIQP